MPRVLMIDSLFGEDRTDWCRGEVHEASERYARELVGRGAAVLVEGDVAPAAPLTTQAFVAPDPVAEHREPVRATPRKKR